MEKSHLSKMLNKYHMHKSERELKDPGKMKDILRRGKYITLALSLDDDPYILTLSYGYEEKTDRLYFHTASKGLKLRIIDRNPKVCGTVIEDLGYQHGECSHRFRSVVIFGTIFILDDIRERKHAMMTMFEHLEKHPDAMKERFLKDDDAYSKMNILRLDIHEITGKESS